MLVSKGNLHQQIEISVVSGYFSCVWLIPSHNHAVKVLSLPDVALCCCISGPYISKDYSALISRIKQLHTYLEYYAEDESTTGL